MCLIRILHFISIYYNSYDQLLLFLTSYEFQCEAKQKGNKNIKRSTERKRTFYMFCVFYLRFFTLFIFPLTSITTWNRRILSFISMSSTVWFQIFFLDFFYNFIISIHKKISVLQFFTSLRLSLHTELSRRHQNNTQT